MKRLNIGAGSDIRSKDEGWVNLDVRPLLGIDIVSDIRTPLPFDDNTFDEVLANDVLEHIPLLDIPNVISEWHRVLRPRGTLHVRVPNIRRIAARLVSGVLDDRTAVWLLYGDQTSESGGPEWGSHHNGFTESLLRDALEGAGFVVDSIAPHETEYNIYATAGKP